MRLLGILVIAAFGCTRDPIEAQCPDVSPGDLVVTEIRGPQSGTDMLGTWVELYNASGSSVNLFGVKIRFRKKDGSSEVPVIIRRDVTVQANGYAVLGLIPDAERPAYVDYGFSSDFHVGFLASAAIDVEACGERIDRMIYDVLPKMGTYSLGGAPTADNNDLPTAWCTDATMDAGTYPGSPQRQNIACP